MGNAKNRDLTLLPQILLLLCVFILLISSTALAQDYEIKLHRPGKAGDKDQISALVSRSTHMTMLQNGLVLRVKYESTLIKLDGIIDTLAVDSRGYATEFGLTVSKCTLLSSIDAEEKKVLPAGTHIIARPGKGKYEYLIEGKPAAQNVSEILGLIFIFPKEKSTDNDVFGTKERKKVGDSWSINKEAMVADLNDVFLKRIDMKNVDGYTKLVQVVDVDGIPCLHLAGKINISKLVLPSRPGFNIESATAVGDFAGEFPIDTSISRVSQVTSNTLSVLSRGRFVPSDPEVEIQYKKNETRQYKVRPLNVEKTKGVKSMTQGQVL